MYVYFFFLSLLLYNEYNYFHHKLQLEINHAFTFTFFRDNHPDNTQSNDLASQSISSGCPQRQSALHR